MGNIPFKKNIAIFIILFSLLFSANSFCLPWNNNTREHLFSQLACANDCNAPGHNHNNIHFGAICNIPGCLLQHASVPAPGQLYNERRHICNLQHYSTTHADRRICTNKASIRDEGYRWRDSFNFTITPVAGGGGALNPQPIDSWEFNGIITVNHSGRLFVSNNNFQQNIAAGADGIHCHLSDIIKNVGDIYSGISTSAAAVTIVVEHPTTHNYHAYSKVVADNENKAIIMQNRGATIPEDAMIATEDINAASIRNAANHANLGCNVSNQYACTEGKIITYLINEVLHFANFKKALHDLLMEARKPGQLGNGVNYSNIKLIIFHIGTTMDPCAICTRYMAGLSKYVNGYNQGGNKNGLFKKVVAEGAIGGDVAKGVKFLIEVSSCGHYSGGGNKNDSFTYYGYPNCSHTECAGRDGQTAEQININLGAQEAGEAQLSIPNGKGDATDWKFRRSFPPYIVFGRVKATQYNVANAPNAHLAPDNIPPAELPDVQ